MWAPRGGATRPPPAPPRWDAGPSCATGAARSFPANSVSSRVRIATPAYPRVLPTAARSVPKPRSPRDPARTSSHSATPRPRPSAPAPRDASGSHLLGAHGRRVVQEPRGGATQARGAQEQEEKQERRHRRGPLGRARPAARSHHGPGLRGGLAPGLGAQRGRAPGFPSSESRVSSLASASGFQPCPRRAAQRGGLGAGQSFRGSLPDVRPRCAPLPALLPELLPELVQPRLRREPQVRVSCAPAELAAIFYPCSYCQAVKLYFNTFP